MQPDDGLKVVGLVSVALTWLAIAYIMFVTPRELSKSISHHAAINKGPYYLFATAMTVATFLMWLFMMGWLGPALLLPLRFSILVTIAVMLEIVATWVPLTTGLKYVVHQTCSYGAAILMPIILLVILTSPLVNKAARVIVTGALLLIALLIVLGVFVKASRKHYLLYQSLYVAVFHGALLFVAFIK